MNKALLPCRTYDCHRHTVPNPSFEQANNPISQFWQLRRLCTLQACSRLFPGPVFYLRSRLQTCTTVQVEWASVTVIGKMFQGFLQDSSNRGKSTGQLCCLTLKHLPRPGLWECTRSAVLGYGYRIPGLGESVFTFIQQ